MANKRQRLARKRFVLTSGAVGLNDFINLEKKPPANPLHTGDVPHDGSVDNQARKKLKQESRSSEGKSKLKRLTKHPLRVSGKKPGEGCFICKSANHIAKNCPEKLEKDRKKVCLFCREMGHTLSNCPSRKQAPEAKFCYNCGEVGHRLAECKKPRKDGGTAFAECFLCKQKGHLSKQCPSNTHGIYPKGGSCKVCGGVTHFAKDCPKKMTGNSHAPGLLKVQISKEVASASHPGTGSKRITFGSGDDLEDDFLF